VSNRLAHDQIWYQSYHKDLFQTIFVNTTL